MIAHLLRGGNFAYAFVCPRDMRSTRDLLRRRVFFARKRGELLAHIQNTNTQYNLEPLEKRIDRAVNRDDLLEHFADDENVQMSIAANMALLDSYDGTITELELFLASQAKVHDAASFYLLRSIPGVGPILSMTMIYEIYDISRFPSVGHFLSYSRLVRGSWESDGKKKRGASGAKKIGNVHLKWAFSEAAALFLRGNPVGQAYGRRLERKHGKGKAMSVLAAKLGRAVFYMLKLHQPFDLNRFVAA